MRYPARFGTGSRNRALDGLGISDLLTRSPAMNVPRIELLSSGPFERSACFSGRRSVAFCNRRVTVHEVQRFLPLRGPDLPGKEAGQDQDHDRHLHRPRAPKASRATRSISAAARAKRAICGYSCTTLRTRIRRAHARFITQIAARAHCRGLMLAARPGARTPLQRLHTANTCFRSVCPAMTFWMPSCSNVVMPAFRACLRMSSMDDFF